MSGCLTLDSAHLSELQISDSMASGSYEKLQRFLIVGKKCGLARNRGHQILPSRWQAEVGGGRGQKAKSVR